MERYNRSFYVYGVDMKRDRLRDGTVILKSHAVIGGDVWNRSPAGDD